MIQRTVPLYKYNLNKSKYNKLVYFFSKSNNVLSNYGFISNKYSNNNDRCIFC